MKLTDLEIAALEQAAEELDVLWDFDAERGFRDSRPGAEYERLSMAPVLRRIAERDRWSSPN
jgi:hypothetical protein